MCEYGEPWQKYTTLATSVQPLQALGCGCSHKSHAVRLRGQVQVKKHDGTARYVDRTALAGAYPVKLVNLYADVISQHVKLHCDDLKFIQTAWSASLRNLVDRKAQATLPRCQRVGHPIQWGEATSRKLGQSLGCFGKKMCSNIRLWLAKDLVNSQNHRIWKILSGKLK